jgi:hypothetical protein
MYIRGLVLPLSCLSFLSSSYNILYYLSNTTLLPVSVSSCLSPSAPSPSLALIPVTQPCPRSLALGYLTFPPSGPARPRPTLRIPSPHSYMVPCPVTSSLEPTPVPSRPVTPTSVQHFINDILRPYLDIFVTAYLDDILIYSNNLEEHKKYVLKVLKALSEAGLHLKPEKCEFDPQEVKYLGFIILTSGTKMDLVKVATIQE